MRKIRKKPAGPTLSDSKWIIVIGVGVVLLIIVMMVYGSRTGQQATAMPSWQVVAGVKTPVLDGLGAPRQAVPREQLSRSLGVEGDLLVGAGGRWYLVYDLTAPPAQAEVIFFSDFQKAHDLLAKTPGLTPLAGPAAAGFGEEAFTRMGGGLSFRRGAAIVRLQSTGNETGTLLSAARIMDQALQRSFGDRP